MKFEKETYRERHVGSSCSVLCQKVGETQAAFETSAHSLHGALVPGGALVHGASLTRGIRRIYHFNNKNKNHA